jgi:hypothetical protein
MKALWVSLGLLVLLTVGCATTSKVYYEPVSSDAALLAGLKPKDPSQVSYYLVGSKPDRKYTVVGFAYVQISSQTDTPEKCYQAMVKEAARRGADAVVDITIQTNQQKMTKDSGSQFGNAGGVPGSKGHEGKTMGYRGIVVLWEK